MVVPSIIEVVRDSIMQVVALAIEMLVMVVGANSMLVGLTRVNTRAELVRINSMEGILGHSIELVMVTVHLLEMSRGIPRLGRPTRVFPT